MLQVKLTIKNRNPDDNKTYNRAFGYVNPLYLKEVSASASSSAPSPTDKTVSAYQLPTGYNSFWEWADAVARGINSLTNNTYADSYISSEWSVTEEIYA